MRTTPVAGITVDLESVLPLTDMACTAGTLIVTSVAGGFTEAMVGMMLVIASGTHFVPGRYEILARVDINTILVDSEPTTGGNGSAGVGYVGTVPTMAQVILPADANHPRFDKLRLSSNDLGCFWSLDGGMTWNAYRDGSLTAPVAIELSGLGIRGEDTVSVKVSAVPRVFHCQLW